MNAAANEEIKKYLEWLKSEFAELETCLQNGTATTKQLRISSKRLALAAAQLDEMILRPLASAAKLQRKLEC